MLDRDEAAQQFTKAYIGFLDSQPSTTKAHYVIAHSHGGSVALAALLQNEVLSKRISGIACMATPFLVVTERDLRTKLSLAVGEAALAFCTVSIVLGGLVGLTPGDPRFNAESVVAGIAILMSCLTSWRSYALSKVARRSLVPGIGISKDIAARLLIIRAAGDEAAAALGAAYILRWALVKAASAVAVLLALPARLVTWLARILGFGSKWIGATAVGTILLLFMAQWTWPSVFSFHRYDLIGKRVLVYFAAVYCLGLTAVAFRESVATVVHGIVSALVGLVTLPFGYDLFLATPYLIVAAEAVPPAADVGNTAKVIQLKLKSTKELQHCVYEDGDTPKAIASWIAQDLNAITPRGVRRTSAV